MFHVKPVNGDIPSTDLSVSSSTKSVIFISMIVNSDERQWTWMDEGINTFVQTITERAWEENCPAESASSHYDQLHEER